MIPWTNPGSPTNPIIMVEGAIIVFSVKWTGASSVTVSAITCYKNESDISSTAFASGSTSASGDTITWKPLTAIVGDGGEVYIVASKCAVDSNTDVVKTYIKILADEAEA